MSLCRKGKDSHRLGGEKKTSVGSVPNLVIFGQNELDK
jgi:hypothetical protein